MNIGKNIRDKREAKGLTQLTLSNESGVGTSMICQIEKGMKIPSLAVALSIAKALECTVDELCREESA